jgi:hypothetical protein
MVFVLRLPQGHATRFRVPQLGAELFANGREGSATAHPKASTMVDVGGYYEFKHHPGEQFLFCYGHSVAGQTENYAYV